MADLNTIPKCEQPERGKPRLFLNSFADQAKDVIDGAYIYNPAL